MVLAWAALCHYEHAMMDDHIELDPLFLLDVKKRLEVGGDAGLLEDLSYITCKKIRSGEYIVRWRFRGASRVGRAMDEFFRIAMTAGERLTEPAPAGPLVRMLA